MKIPVCALLAVLLIWAAASAGADSHRSSDPEVARARALVEIAEFGAALAVLRTLPRDRPDRVDVLFLTGLAAMGAAAEPEAADERDALLDEAITALRAILIDRPDLVRVRLELARALFLKGEDGPSTRHFERVLAGAPPAVLAANVHRFLAAMRARRRFSMYAGGSIAPDSNIGAVSDSEIIYIRGLPFHRDGDTGATSGVGVVVWGGGEYQYPLNDRVRLRAGADGVRREYAGRRFDQTFAALHLGPRWLVDPSTEVSLLATADRHWLGGAPGHDGVGARLEARRRLGPRLSARARASWRTRDYRAPNEALTGPVRSFSAGGTWVISPTLLAAADTGYEGARSRAQRWRNATRWVRADVSVALPRGFTAGAGGEFRWTRYRGDWFPFTPDGSARGDRTRILRVSAFNRRLTLFGFSPELLLAHEARKSNAQLYDYRRNRAELRFQRLF